MTSNEIITYRFPGGMTSDGSGIVSVLLITLSQNVTIGQKLAVFTSGNFEMEVTAEHNGSVIEILAQEMDIVHKNDVLWKIKTEHNKN